MQGGRATEYVPIPGGNAGLLTPFGMPLHRPYAWLAFATMCVTIAEDLLATQSVAARLGKRTA
jgi:hypothetical protein